MGDAIWDERAPRRRSAPEYAPPLPEPPVGVRVWPVTGPQDGVQLPRQYSYWANAWTSGDLIYVFNGGQDGGVRFFSVHRQTGEVLRLGTLLPHYGGTGEGWSWDRDGRIVLCDGPRLRRVSPFTSEDTILCDISGTHPGCQLWQAHASADGRTHSATVQQIVPEGSYPKLGTLCVRDGAQRFYPAVGALDESQIDPSGRFLLIKETRQRDRPRLDNRILDLDAQTDTWLLDEDGAVGHSDMGAGFVVGEDDQLGACTRRRLDAPHTQPLPLFPTRNLGYVAVRGGRCLHSGESHLSLVDLGGGGVTPLLAHGNQNPSGDYDDRVKANLSPDGRVVCYMSNASGRREVYVAVLEG